VQILAAPDNGLGQFAAAATVVTAADGSWSAPLAPGPSRLIEAVYAGDGTTEPVTSAQVKLIVPARIGMSVSPRVLPWSGTVTIHGHLMGGYVPPDGVALRLLIRYPATGDPRRCCRCARTPAARSRSSGALTPAGGSRPIRSGSRRTRPRATIPSPRPAASTSSSRSAVPPHTTPGDAKHHTTRSTARRLSITSTAASDDRPDPW